MTNDKPKITEEERLAKLRKLDNTPSPNPAYKGLTPGDAARALMQPVTDDAPVKHSL